MDERRCGMKYGCQTRLGSVSSSYRAPSTSSRTSAPFPSCPFPQVDKQRSSSLEVQNQRELNTKSRPGNRVSIGRVVCIVCVQERETEKEGIVLLAVSQQHPPLDHRRARRPESVQFENQESPVRPSRISSSPRTTNQRDESPALGIPRSRDVLRRIDEDVRDTRRPNCWDGHWLKSHQATDPEPWPGCENYSQYREPKALNPPSQSPSASALAELRTRALYLQDQISSLGGLQQVTGSQMPC
ncbi:hypothetical protein DFH06DRAFT_1192841 [Mycena polygramma]|nr:hypothetical protein DFH06DRAFT_1192841 [Mycena polygramma]